MTCYNRSNARNRTWLDDDENEFGEHLWLVYAKCPYCGKENYYEIWDDFHTDLDWEEVQDV